MTYQVTRHILPKICVFIYTGTWIISRCCWLLLVQLRRLVESLKNVFEKFKKKFLRARARRAGKIKI
jgi:hypothetical protein